MLREALELLLKVGSDSNRIQTVDLPGNKRIIQIPGEDLIELELDPKVRKEAVGDLASLLDWVSANEASVIWIGTRQIYAERDASKPFNNHNVSMMLEHSVAWNELINWFSSSRTQKAAVRSLMGPLAGSIGAETVRIFRTLDFTRRSDGTRNVVHTGESFGRSVETQAQSKHGEIPEVLAFNVYPFANLPYQTAIAVGVEIDGESDRILLYPRGDTLGAAIDVVRNELRSKLAADLPEVQVYLA